MSFAGQQNNVISVSEAINLTNSILDNVVLVIQGEVTNVKSSQNYSAVYFSIKDEKSCLPCLIWNNRYIELGFEIEEGMLVKVTGKFSIYSKRGSLSFSAFSIEAAGEGALRAKVSKTLEKLEKEGLFDEEHKTKIPAFPEKIGVITSGSGAAIHDVIRTIKRRSSSVEVSFWGVPLEGINAAKKITQAILELEEVSVDVILLVRGGGSFEDLMPFNDEALCRVIYSAKTPIITGIGHEPDVTIADFVSDLRASTPTAAAEIATENLMKIPEYISSSLNSLSNLCKKNISQLRSLLKRYSLFLETNSPVSVLEQAKLRFDFDLGHMNNLSDKIVSKHKMRLANCIKRLEDLSPLNILTRGYTYVFDDNKTIIKSVNMCSINDTVSVGFFDGVLNCEVKSVNSKTIF